MSSSSESHGTHDMNIAFGEDRARHKTPPQPAGVRVRSLLERIIDLAGPAASGTVLDAVEGLSTMEKLARETLAALEPQQEEAVAITPHMLNAGTEQITVPSYDADDKKDLAVKVFRAMILARTSAHLTPVQVQESQTVSEEMVERAAEIIWNDFFGARGGAWDNPPADSVSGMQTRATARAALTAALETSHVR